MIAFDAFTNGGFINPVNPSTSFSHTCTGSNRFLVVALQSQFSAGDVVTGITYAGVSMTKLFNIQLPGGDYIAYYYLVNPASGANNVVISTSGNAYVGPVACSYTGVDQTSPIDDSDNVTNASNAALSTTALDSTVSNTRRIEVFASAGTASDPTSSDTKRGVNSDVYVSVWDSNADLSIGSNNITFTPAGAAVRNGIFATLIKPFVSTGGRSFASNRSSASNRSFASNRSLASNRNFV